LLQEHLSLTKLTTWLCRLDGIVHTVARRAVIGPCDSSYSHLRSLAGILMNNGQEPAKDWPQAFYKRHPELKAVSMKAIDWQRHEKNIRVKVEHWFEIMDKQLSQRDIIQENVYNMDETGVLLSDLNTVKVIVSRSDAQRNRGVGLRRTMITAIK
jgi:hypothetical protein